MALQVDHQVEHDEGRALSRHTNRPPDAATIREPLPFFGRLTPAPLPKSNFMATPSSIKSPAPVNPGIYKTAAYIAAYAQGAKSAERRDTYANPYRATAVAEFQGWADGYYDTWSARANGVVRSSAFRTAGAGEKTAVLSG